VRLKPLFLLELLALLQFVFGKAKTFFSKAAVDMIISPSFDVHF
jgi:hypothetical protein